MSKNFLKRKIVLDFPNVPQKSTFCKFSIYNIRDLKLNTNLVFNAATNLIRPTKIFLINSNITYLIKPCLYLFFF